MELKDKTIGEIVAEDFRTAAIFKKYGIDFCCKGGRTITEACDKKDLNENQLINDLNTITKEKDDSLKVNDWSLDLLTDYIVRKHHNYVREKTPYLLQFLDKLCRVHGGRHPELIEINKLFTENTYELEKRMEKEEQILFPLIGELTHDQQNNQAFLNLNFEKITNTISIIKEMFTTEAHRFESISQLTDKYTPPMDACSTYRVAFAMLQEFEENLLQSIHLENNILFPKIVDLKTQLN
ncbi:iron-sulfur cluster repair di-iron protein [Capnocytophaga sp. H4358]|uniref:iron-sulfur cluster repair di-iron protein n=1 Tax=Capnocytophaga sp. H4358 TaxID=1945658 RepID=UPI000BB1AD1A|nr:iron-sulfur cluster repair di-iron protein [Capnocytophaga sp. H4358]ATA73381.1 iron-sulfur cluster repair di-iron protein [Capnocytophaga sp. H4358]